MEEYKELDDPIDKVYRIRLALLEEHGGIKRRMLVFNNYSANPKPKLKSIDLLL
jgi:hypothetical protein